MRSLTNNLVTSLKRRTEPFVKYFLGGANSSAFFLRSLFPSLFIILSLSLLTGCHVASYPEDKVISSIQEICKKEYNIENVEVKIVGKTIGVLLPLKKLFTMDVRHLVVSGQVENLESLFLIPKYPTSSPESFFSSTLFMEPVLLIPRSTDMWPSVFCPDKLITDKKINTNKKL